MCKGDLLKRKLHCRCFYVKNKELGTTLWNTCEKVSLKFIYHLLIAVLQHTYYLLIIYPVSDLN